MQPYYDYGQITIYHGDCREVLPSLGADVLVTDPPYGVAADVACRRDGTRWQIAGDQSVMLRDWVLEWWGARPAIVFGSWKVARPVGLRACLVWDKGDHIGAGDLAFPWKATSWEEIYVLGSGFAGRRTAGVLRYPGISPNFVERDHPTEKPLALMRDLVNKCPPGVILDPFMGSGTTLRAAKDCGRRAIGIEIEERYCAIAVERLRQGVLL